MGIVSLICEIISQILIVIVSAFSLFLCVVILVEGFKFNPFEGDRPQKESD